MSANGKTEECTTSSSTSRQEANVTTDDVESVEMTDVETHARSEDNSSDAPEVFIALLHPRQSSGESRHEQYVTTDAVEIHGMNEVGTHARSQDNSGDAPEVFIAPLYPRESSGESRHEQYVTTDNVERKKMNNVGTHARSQNISGDPRDFFIALLHPRESSGESRHEQNVNGFSSCLHRYVVNAVRRKFMTTNNVERQKTNNVGTHARSQNNSGDAPEVFIAPLHPRVSSGVRRREQNVTAKYLRLIKVHPFESDDSDSDDESSGASHSSVSSSKRRDEENVTTEDVEMEEVSSFENCSNNDAFLALSSGHYCICFEDPCRCTLR